MVGVAGRPRLAPGARTISSSTLLGSSPGVVGRGGQPGGRVEQHERATSLRKRGGQEQRASGPPSVKPRIAARFDPAASMTATDVRHLGLEVGETIERHRIGQAGAAPVEDDQAPDRRQPPPLAGQLRDLPERLDVVHPALDQHEVERALAQDLVREVDVAVLRVLGRRETVHGAPAWQSPLRSPHVEPRRVRAAATSASDHCPVAATNSNGTSKVESRSGRITPS